MQVVKVLTHAAKVNAVAWHPSEATTLCSVGEDEFALIWLINNGESDDVSVNSQVEQEPHLQYKAASKIYNLAWSQAST